MSGRTPTTAPVTTDPWAAFGYIVSGVAVYGAAGWGLGLWLDTKWLTPVGILVGAALGTYMVVARYRVGMAAVDGAEPGAEATPAAPTDRPPAHEVSTHLPDRSTTSRGDTR